MAFSCRPVAFITIALFLSQGLEATNFSIVNSCTFPSNVEFTGVDGLYLLPGQSVQVAAQPGWSGRISLNPEPSSLAEFTIEENNKNTMDISLVDGFNVGLSISYTGGGCIRNGSPVASGIECRIRLEECPVQYRSGVRCVSPNKDAVTDYSTAVKGVCPDAYSWSKDDATSTFTCDVGGNYVVNFCP